jgi:hypothetical protein
VIGHAGSIEFMHISTAYNFSGGNTSFQVWRNVNIWARIFLPTYIKESQYMDQSYKIYFLDHIYNIWQQKIIKMMHTLYFKWPTTSLNN